MLLSGRCGGLPRALYTETSTSGSVTPLIRQTSSACRVLRPNRRACRSMRRTERGLRCATVTRATATVQRSGPTGLDVFDDDGKAFRPTSLGGWEIISSFLKEKGVRFIAPQEVAFAAEEGLPIVDIRPASEYSKGHIEGAKNVEFYQLIQGWDAWRIARRFMFTFFGVVGTEPNEDFLEDFLEVAEPSKGAVLVCNLGGNLDEDYQPSRNGYQTRSLMAAYHLFRDGGFEDLRVLTGGMGDWARQGRDMTE